MASDVIERAEAIAENLRMNGTTGMSALLRELTAELTYLRKHLDEAENLLREVARGHSDTLHLTCTTQFHNRLITFFNNLKGGA